MLLDIICEIGLDWLCTANIYDGITMRLQRIIVLVLYSAVDFNYSGKSGKFLYEKVKPESKKRGRILYVK